MLRLTRNQVREIDRRAIEQYHIPGVVLMENAARSFVDILGRLFPLNGQTVLVVCGAGNNGGDGFAIARHLHNRGCAVSILRTKATLSGDALVNWQIAEAMGLVIREVDPAEVANPFTCDLVIDALFGTGLSRTVDIRLAELIERINKSGLAIVAVDVPSGLDCDTGEPLGACIRATHAVTFAAEKVGFGNPRSRMFTGEVTVGDIGCPRELIEEVATLRL